MKLQKLVLVLSFLLVSSLTIRAQDDWKKIAPSGESFTIAMPTAAVEGTRRIEVSNDEWVPARVYSSLADGRRYVVASFVRTTLNRTPALSSVNAFLKAMEWSLTKAEGQTATLTFAENLSDESGVAQQYQLQIGNYPGVAQFIGNEESFYALMVIGADKNDSDAQRFLRSFLVGKPNEDDEPGKTNVIAILEGEAASLELPPEPWPKKFAPITGGVLNGKATHLEVPKYPNAARQNHDEGMVRVRIVIDEYGKVISAEQIGGPESFREVAIHAALKSRFTPTRLMGQPVKVSGVIIYNFVAQ